MKKKRFLIPMVLCLLAALALGTMAVYATGNLQSNGTYSKMDLGEVTLDHHFTKVKTGVYKITTEGKHINARPVVKNENGTVLKAEKDYTVEYNFNRRVNPGKYTITVTGTGEYRGTETLTLIITPAGPESVKARLSRASGGYDDAYVYWSESNRATGYNVYGRRPSKTKEWSYLGRTTDTHFLEKNLYDGWLYEFKVVPYITRDDIRYSSSEYGTGKVTTLKKVGEVKAERYSSSKVRVRWKNISGESGYQISRSTGKTKTYALSPFATTGGSSRLVSATKNKGYYYKVRAYKSVGDKKVYGPWSDPVKYTLR